MGMDCRVQLAVSILLPYPLVRCNVGTTNRRSTVFGLELRKRKSHFLSIIFPLQQRENATKTTEGDQALKLNLLNFCSNCVVYTAYGCVYLSN